MVLKPDDEIIAVAKSSILLRCLKEVETRKNFLSGKQETILRYVSGKWRLKKDALDIMKTLQSLQGLQLNRQAYDLYASAFERALITLLQEGLLKEDREYPRRYNSYKRKFAITEQGLAYLGFLRKIEVDRSEDS